MITGGGALRETQGEGGNARIAAAELNDRPCRWLGVTRRGRPGRPLVAAGRPAEKLRLPIRIAVAAFAPDAQFIRQDGALLFHPTDTRHLIGPAQSRNYAGPIGSTSKSRRYSSSRSPLNEAWRNSPSVVKPR
jgi:hypothetical protein